MKPSVTRFDHIAFHLYRFLTRWNSWIWNFCLGWIVGRLVNEASVSSRDFFDIFPATFSLSRNAVNIASWIAAFFTIFVPVVHRWLKKYYKRRQYDRVFASRVKRLRAPEIAPFDSFAIGHSLSLQICPEIHRGWPLSDVRIVHDTTKFSIPDRYRQSYSEYKKRYYEEKRFFDDGVKIMMTHNPGSSTDSPTLVLRTQETCYSHVQFYKDYIAVNRPVADSLVRALIDGNVQFPHSLSLHLVVVTSDDKVLITKRSEKLAYYSGKWSCSLEEQLSPEDLRDGGEGALLKWGQRTLLEELGLGKGEYNNDNFRLLSIFLESDILNVSLCGHVVLDIESNDLDERLHGLPRADYEFPEWRYLEFEELLGEVFEPKRSYHPTSGYRMIMALIRQSGEPRVAEALRRLE